MNANEHHARAHQVYAAVLAHVTDADLAKPTPCAEWDVAALIDHINAGNAQVVAASPDRSSHAGQARRRCRPGRRRAGLTAGQLTSSAKRRMPSSRSASPRAKLKRA